MIALLTEDEMRDLKGRMIKDFGSGALSGDDGHFGIILERREEDDLPDNVYPGIRMDGDGGIRKETYKLVAEDTRNGGGAAD